MTTGREATRSACLDCGKTFDAEGTADLHGMTKGHAITSGRQTTVRPPPDDACLAESIDKGDPYHPCVCACMVGHIGRHYCRCGFHWVPDRVSPPARKAT